MITRPYSDLEIDTHIESLRGDVALHEQLGNTIRAARIEKTLAIIEQLRNPPEAIDTYRLYDQNKKLIVTGDTITDFINQVSKLVKLKYHLGNLKQRLRDMKLYLKHPAALGDGFVITKNTVLTEDIDLRNIKQRNRSVGMWYLVDLANQTITEYARLCDVVDVTKCSAATIQSSIRRDSLFGQSRYAVRRTKPTAKAILKRYNAPPPKPRRRTIRRIDLFHEGRTTVIKSMPDFRGLLGLVGCTEKTLLTELRNSNDGELRSLPKTPGYQVRVYFTNNCTRKKDKLS